MGFPVFLNFEITLHIFKKPRKTEQRLVFSKQPSENNLTLCQSFPHKYLFFSANIFTSIALEEMLFIFGILAIFLHVCGTARSLPTVKLKYFRHIATSMIYNKYL
jgi:hypothetical protein